MLLNICVEFQVRGSTHVHSFLWVVNTPPSKHLLVLKTSSRHVLKTSSTRLQCNNFTSSKTSWRRLAKTFWRYLARRLEDVLEDEKLLRWRRLEDVLKTCLEDVLKTCLEDVLKTYLEDVFKTSRRQTKFLLVISVSNKSKCVSNKSMFHKSISDKSKTNPKCVT